MRTGTIVLDPGHGGGDTGATGNGLTESAVNLRVCGLTAMLLTEQRQAVMLTRTADNRVSLTDRAGLANADGISGLISVHCNAFSDPNAHGFEIFHWPYSPDGIRLAESIRDAVAAAFPVLALRGDRRGLKADKRLAMLRLTKRPAALVELGFLTNQADAELLRTRQMDFAEALAIGMMRWLAL